MHQRLLFISLVLLTLSSCRITTITHEYSKRPPLKQTDSVIVLRLIDDRKVPDSAFLVGTVELKEGVNGNKGGYDSILAVAGRVARLEGGNVLKVTKAQPKHIRFTVVANIYSLNPTSLAAYKAAWDSTENAYQSYLKGKSVVHIKDYDEQGARPVFFNDTLVAKIKGVGFDSIRKPGRKDLVFSDEGILKIENDKFQIEFGKEYYIVLYTTIGHHRFNHYYKLLDREHFENKHILFDWE